MIFLPACPFFFTVRDRNRQQNILPHRTGADWMVNMSDKEKALQTALSQIEKQFGKGAVMKLGQTASLNVEAIPTGSLGLDMALGIGGIPKGRIIEIFGPESSGKTTVALHCVAQAQKAGGEAIFIDVEHALDPVYAKALGVDIDSLLVSQPSTGEEALEICEAMVRSGAIDIVVVDSVAAMTTKAEIEGEMGDSHVGLQARLMSQALRKLTGAISKSNCAVIFINQLREKIGVSYGNPETTPGGRALKFYSSVRLDVRKGEPIKQGTDMIGNRTKIKVVKNKVSPPFKTAEFDIMYGEGISREGEILDAAVTLDIIKKSGSWFSYNGERLGQGRDKVKAYLKENPAFAEDIAAQVMANKDQLTGLKGKKSSKSAEDEDTETTAATTAADVDEEASAAPAAEEAAPPVEDAPPSRPARKAKSIDIEADDK